MRIAIVALCAALLSCDTNNDQGFGDCTVTGCELGECKESYDGIELPGGTCTVNSCPLNGCENGKHCISTSDGSDSFCADRCWSQEQCRQYDGWECACLEPQCSRKACVPHGLGGIGDNVQ